MAEASKGIAQRKASFDWLPPESVLFGKSPAMEQVRGTLEQLEKATVPVLIEGETGTGKELVAKLLHARSGQMGAFLKINCPSAPKALVESNLFGEPVGDNGDRKLRLHTDYITLFLYEVSELDYSLQTYLLGAIQDGRLCGTPPYGSANARIICSSTRDLAVEVEKGSFRRELLYRINVARVLLPPLRERAEDIPDLASYFLRLYNAKFGRSAPPLTDNVLAMLQEHHWPGNTRELENLMKRYVILETPTAITSELIRITASSVVCWPVRACGPITMRQMTKAAIRELEAKLITRTLQANGWSRKETARALDISYRALLYKMRDAGLPLGRKRANGEASPAAPIAADNRNGH